MIKIVFNNAIRCGGMCSYCSVASQEHYIGGVNTKDIINSVRKADSDSYSLIKWDFDALYKTIVNSEYFDGDFSIWGADPLNSFSAFQELYDFLKYLTNKENKTLHMHGSTNGLSFVIDEWNEWLLKHKEEIGNFQLSHDGLGQWVRTRDFDPLELPSIKELVDNNIVRNINCVLNFWNASPFQNIDYFRAHDVGFRTIRIYNAREEKYTTHTLNTLGKLNNDCFNELKLKPLGDLCIRNDIKLAQEYGIKQLAHQADLFFSEYDFIYSNPDKFPQKYVKPLLERVKRNSRRGSFWYMSRPHCAEYHLGKRNTTPIIDTLGKYCDCHLFDSNMHVTNPTMKKPEYCNGCKYFDRYECNLCGAHPLPEDKVTCDFMYRFNALMEKYRNKIK